MKSKKEKDTRPIRACTLPVAECIGSSWEDVRPHLQKAWRLATDAANWCVHELFKRDLPNSPNTPDSVKMNPKGFYSYGEAAKTDWFKDWEGAKQSLSIVLQYAQRKYLQTRFDVMLRHQTNLLTVRYPYPFPVDADGVTLSYIDGGFPSVSLTLPGIGRVKFRLKREKKFSRQMAMFKQLHDGIAKCGEARISQNNKGEWMVTICGRFPTRERQPSPFDRIDKLRACLLHSDPAALLIAEIDGRQAWIKNGDEIRSLHARHKTVLQRMSEDKKRENRMSRRERNNLEKKIAERCKKHHNRIQTALHSITAQVVRFIERQHVGIVAYDDSKKEFIPEGFPWYQLKEQLTYKLKGMGVEFITNVSEKGA